MDFFTTFSPIESEGRVRQSGEHSNLVEHTGSPGCRRGHRTRHSTAEATVRVVVEYHKRRRAYRFVRGRLSAAAGGTFAGVRHGDGQRSEDEGDEGGSEDHGELEEESVPKVRANVPM